MQKEGVSWAVLDNSRNAIVIIGLKIPMRVTFWNKKAEELFGYSRFEVLGKSNPTIPQEYRKESTIIRKEVLKGKTLSYRSKRLNKDGKLIDVLVEAYPYKRNGKIAGIIAHIQALTKLKDTPDILETVNEQHISKKRTFLQIRRIILNALLLEQSTINQISIKTAINWRTVESHLTYLTGRGLIEKVFSSEYVRIFRIADVGTEYLSRKNNKINGYVKLDKKIIKI